MTSLVILKSFLGKLYRKRDTAINRRTMPVKASTSKATEPKNQTKSRFYTNKKPKPKMV